MLLGDGPHDPALAKQLPPLSVTDFIFRFGHSDVLEAIPPDKQLDDPMDLAPGLRPFLESLPPTEQLDDLLSRDRAVCQPEERLRRCDEQGIAVQLINNNWAHMPYMKAREVGRPDLASDVLEAYNTWAAGLLHGHTDRLIPITFLELDDVDRALAELHRMRQAGSRAFTIKPAPVSPDRSLTHPDHEPLWSAAEDLGMVAIFHVGPSGPAPLDPGWLANGGNPSTFNLLNLVQAPSAPDVYWAQHHNGIFHTTNSGVGWAEIAEAGPSTFGFAVAVHPHDADTAWFVPGVNDECRVPVDARFVVTRTRDEGRSFDVLRDGLPQEHCYDIVFRHGLDVDETGDRLACGSSTGGLWISENGGDRWDCFSTTLPQIYCVRFQPPGEC